VSMALRCALMCETRNSSVNATIRRERTFGIATKSHHSSFEEKQSAGSERKLSVRVGCEGSAATDYTDKHGFNFYPCASVAAFI
jgi:hypothetical protein